ncbi:large-conductance mechanosensitive channel protein MscL [Escherichia coli]|nr:large-conductance mechanosensitive channel protein MscL [Escherichia coli]
MSIIKEFREFAMRGNVVDLAVGVIIGAAFGKIVSSLVADIIMPPLGLLIGGIDFKQFAVTLRDAQGDIPAVVMHYGVFIQNVFDFLIVAFAIFMAIKLINKLNRKKEEPAAAPAPTKEEVAIFPRLSRAADAHQVAIVIPVVVTVIHLAVQALAL